MQTITDSQVIDGLRDALLQECARYLETIKVYETKSADAIQGRTEEDYLSRFTAAMTTVRGVNRTDVLTLGRAFGSLAGALSVRALCAWSCLGMSASAHHQACYPLMFAVLTQAAPEEMATCPGFGPTKVRRLQECFHEPFRRALQPSEDVDDAQDIHNLSVLNASVVDSDVASDSE